MIGVISLFLACITSIISFIAYISRFAKDDSKKKSDSKPTFSLADFSYKLSVICIIISSIFLMYVILTDKFQYFYVWSYSSHSLGLSYKIAAFWAGQEGSFLLWLLIHAVLGLYFQKNQSMNQPAFIAYVMVQTLLVILLIIKNPFMLGPAYPDGMGLNPLLQNFWMVIHPPIIFIGYATLAIPFAYAIGGLISTKHKDWIDKALPWALFSWTFLGAGIFIGGYWAYKTLGWGGYWGWDPVENSSLVPWLVSGALIHLLQLAKIKPGAFRFTYFSAIYSFILVLYGTFLTRSGILNDFSVHAFSGDDSAYLLGISIFIVIFAATLVLVFKWGSVYTAPLYQNFTSREFMITAGSILFLGLALLVLIGMSTPLITNFLGNATNVSTNFYNNSTLPLVALLLVLLIFSPIVAWGQIKNINYKRYLFLAIPFFIGVIFCLYYGIVHPLYLLTISLAMAVIAIHIIKRQLSLAAILSHIGLAFLCIGILFSSVAAQQETFSLAVGETQTVYTLPITYQSKTINDSHNEMKQNFSIDGNTISITNKLNDLGTIAAKEPAIYSTLSGDFYIAGNDQSFEISFKPFIFLVWLGCILITLGCLLATIHHFSQK